VEDIGLFEYYADGYGGCDARRQDGAGVTGIFAPLTVPYAEATTRPPPSASASTAPARTPSPSRWTIWLPTRPKPAQL